MRLGRALGTASTNTLGTRVLLRREPTVYAAPRTLTLALWLAVFDSIPAECTHADETAANT